MSFSISGTPTQQVYNPQPIKKRPQPDFSLEDDEAFYAAQRRVVERPNKRVSFNSGTTVVTYYRSYPALDCIGYMENGITK